MSRVSANGLAEPSLHKQDLVINLVEVPKENWSSEMARRSTVRNGAVATPPVVSRRGKRSDAPVSH